MVNGSVPKGFNWGSWLNLVLWHSFLPLDSVFNSHMYWVAGVIAGYCENLWPWAPICRTKWNKIMKMVIKSNNRNWNSTIYTITTVAVMKVILLFKGGDTLDPNWYRPISILPCLSKVFESQVNKTDHWSFQIPPYFLRCAIRFPSLSRVHLSHAQGTKRYHNRHR